MSQGWIKLHRQIRDNDLWKRKPFDPARAWIDLLLLADHADGSFWKRGIEIELKRGDVGWSIKGLAAEWGWTRGKVERFLNHLESRHQITQQRTRLSTVITILNYAQYQDNDQQTVPKTRNRQATDAQQTSTDKNGKNEKNGKEGEEVTPCESETEKTREIVHHWQNLGRNPKDYTAIEGRTHRSITKHLNCRSPEEIKKALDRVAKEYEHQDFRPWLANLFGRESKITPYYGDLFSPATQTKSINDVDYQSEHGRNPLNVETETRP